ncbi:MAG: hypothetical protein A3K25_01590 [Planctomycetes bacterium RIFOXYB12_FULL_42_10]|nr:MAG: hypothetical protein A3K25_01590 [Planctomycetes bacterium RIFOXYB12_FULL_42_10]
MHCNIEYQICNSCINHNDDKRNTIDTRNVRDLYYRQKLILGVSNKKPGKSGKEKGSDILQRNPCKRRNDNERQL